MTILPLAITHGKNPRGTSLIRARARMNGLLAWLASTVFLSEDWVHDHDEISSPVQLCKIGIGI
jgi:hypothetical protein